MNKWLNENIFSVALLLAAQSLSLIMAWVRNAALAIIFLSTCVCLPANSQSSSLYTLLEASDALYTYCADKDNKLEYRKKCYEMMLDFDREILIEIGDKMAERHSKVKDLGTPEKPKESGSIPYPTTITTPNWSYPIYVTPFDDRILEIQ